MRCKLLFIIWTPTLFNYILVVILIFYRFGDCIKSSMRTKSIENGLRRPEENWGKPCDMLEIVEECLISINGNCATEARISSDLSQLQGECDLEKSGGCALNRTESRKLFFIILTLTLFNLILAVITYAILKDCSVTVLRVHINRRR